MADSSPGLQKSQPIARPGNPLRIRARVTTKGVNGHRRAVAGRWPRPKSSAASRFAVQNVHVP